MEYFSDTLSNSFGISNCLSLNITPYFNSVLLGQMLVICVIINIKVECNIRQHADSSLMQIITSNPKLLIRHDRFGTKYIQRIESVSVTAPRGQPLSQYTAIENKYVLKSSHSHMYRDREVGNSRMNVKSRKSILAVLFPFIQFFITYSLNYRHVDGLLRKCRYCAIPVSDL